MPTSNPPPPRPDAGMRDDPTWTRCSCRFNADDKLVRECLSHKDIRAAAHAEGEASMREKAVQLMLGDLHHMLAGAVAISFCNHDELEWTSLSKTRDEKPDPEIGMTKQDYLNMAEIALAAVRIVLIPAIRNIPTGGARQCGGLGRMIQTRPKADRMTSKAEHELVDGTLYIERGGVIGRCACGWTTGHRFSRIIAHVAFQDHKEAASSAPSPAPEC